MGIRSDRSRRVLLSSAAVLAVTLAGALPAWSQANAPPVNTVPGTQTATEDVPLSITGIAISDPDAGGAAVQVTLSVGAGTLTLATTAGLSFTSGDGTADTTMVFTGTIAAINAALSTVTFAPGADVTASQALLLTTDDLGNSGAGGPLSDTDIVIINIAAVNDAPVVSGPASRVGPEDTSMTFTGGNLISISDIDATGGATFTVTTTGTNGTVTVANTAGLIFTGGANGSSTMTFTGNLTDVNAALASVSFLPTADYNGPAQLVVQASDGGSSGTGGTQTGSRTIPINVSNVNDAPVLTVPGAQTINEDSVLVLTGVSTISVADIDSGALSVTLDVTTGTLTLGGPTGPLSFSSGDGSADAAMAFSGTIANINAALATVTFNPALNASGPVTLTVTLSDGALGDNKTVSITVNAVNDPPGVSLPPPPTVNEDALLVLSAPSTIVISDIDAGVDPVQVSLSVGNGTLTLAGMNGLTVTGGTNGSAAVTFSGTLTNIQAALDGLVYAPTTNFAGADLLTVSVSDLGGNGSGGPQTALGTLPIAVAPVNDGPVNTLPAAQTIAEDTLLVFSSGGGTLISIADVDAGSSPVQVTLSVTNGLLSLSGTAGLTFSAGDGTSDATMTFSGPLSAVNPALNGLTLAPSASFVGICVLTLTTNDQGNTGSGGALSDTDNLAVTITGVNDPPLNTVPAAQSTPEDTPLVFSASIADIDIGSGAFLVTLTTTNGTLTLGATAGLTFTSGADGTAAMAFTGTAIDINAALTGMAFASPPDLNGIGSFTIVTSDQGFSGAGGPLIDTDAVAITITPVNDLPTTTADAYSTPRFTALEVPAATGLLSNDTDIDGDPLIVAGAPLTVSTSAGGSATLAADGSFTYVAPFGFFGNDTFTYAVSDGLGTSPPVTVSIDVNLVGSGKKSGCGLTGAEGLLLMLALALRRRARSV